MKMEDDFSNCGSESNKLLNDIMSVFKYCLYILSLNQAKTRGKLTPVLEVLINNYTKANLDFDLFY